MQLPPELADVGDARREDADRSDLDPAAAREREAFVRDIGARGRFEDVARTRSPQPECAPGRGHVIERGGAVLWKMVLEPLPVARTVQTAGDDAEEVLAEPHDREVCLEAAVMVEVGRVDDESEGDF